MNIALREKIYKYVQSKYGSEFEYLWAKFPHYAVFRHKENRKWYGIIMNVPYKKLGLNKDGEVDILNVKIADSNLIDFLLHQNGYLKGYHIRSRAWISILLDGSVVFDDITKLIDISYDVTLKK